MKGFVPAKPIDFGSEIRAFEEQDSGPEEFFYWRKHPNLHGLMSQIYQEKGGLEVFNCVPVMLEQADLDRIREEVMARNLPNTEGFFFGESTDEDYKQDLEFLDLAQKSLTEGYTVWYDSWW